MRLGIVEQREVGCLWALYSRKPRAHLLTKEAGIAAMNVHSASDDSADSPALLARSLHKLRQSLPLRYLGVMVNYLLALFAHEESKDTDRDIALGDQVTLPEEFLNAVSRMPDSHDRKE